MDWNFSWLTGLFAQEPQRSLLHQGRFGLEKEALRITPAGDLALTPHPAALGDKQTNPYVTVDFSESQLELITPPFPALTETHRSLSGLQDQVAGSLGNELMWPLSMPARLPSEAKIPLARFDDSPAGREQALYREGLARRYGKKRQLISGSHYNFSFSTELLDFLRQRFAPRSNKQAFASEIYGVVARNFLKYRWLYIYLFGASPVFDPTYASVVTQELGMINRCCPDWVPVFETYPAYATSLRVSQFGYSNSLQQKFFVSFNSLNEYIKDIRRLMRRKHKRYEQLGLAEDGGPIQLNFNIIQKESEFYAPLRFKQVTAEDESQLSALEKRGVGYLEIRIPDLNPYEKTGISLNTLHFLQVFMLFCLFESDKPLRRQELRTFNNNHHLVALAGRKPGLKLAKPGSRPVLLTEWGSEIFGQLKTVAGLLDKSPGNTDYQAVIEQEYRKILDPSLLPSARIRSEMIERQESYLEFGLRHAAANTAQEPSKGEKELCKTI